MSLEGVVPSSSSTQATAYERHSTLDPLSLFDDSSPSEKDPRLSSTESDPSSGPGRKRWGLFKNIIPFSSPGTDRTKAKTVLRTQDDLDRVQSSQLAPVNTTMKVGEISDSKPDELRNTDHAPSDIEQRTHHHRNYSFRFSLEWMDRPHQVARERRLYLPRLPMPAQTYLQSTRVETFESKPREPAGAAIERSRYAGRALAEWTLAVIECQNFFERRKSEGVPGNKWVETPTLAVDSFRRIG